ncbi:hypothetical protein ACFL2H_02190 [Planctomycetota bacterium]
MAIDVGLKEYSAKPYTNDGGFAVFNLIVGTFAGMAMALVAGGFLGVLGHFFSLVFLFPILLSICLGMSLQWLLRWLHVRSRLACVLAASVVAMTAIGAMHFSSFAFVKFGVSNGSYDIDPIKKQYAGATLDERANLSSVVEDFENIAKVESFRDYVEYSANKGICISSAFDQYVDRITGKGAYAYWAIEALIVIAFMTSVAYGRGIAPYCRQCQQWKDKKRFGYLPADPTLVSAIIETGQFQDLPELPIDESKFTVISGYACPHCEFGFEPVIAVDTANKAKKATGEISRTVVSNPAAIVLRSFISHGKVAVTSTLDSEELASV